MGKTKVETLFSDAEVAELFAVLAALPAGKRTGRVVQEWSQARGHYVSERSAIKTVKGAFADFLAELKADREFADDIATVAKAGSDLPEATAMVLSKKIFQTTLRLGEDLDPATADAMTKSVERLRTGNRMAKRLESDLQAAAKKIEVADAQLRVRAEQVEKLQREKTEWEEQRAKIVAVTEKVRAATPATADEVRAAAVAAIDEIMGLKPKK